MPIVGIAGTGDDMPAVLAVRVPGELSELAAFEMVGHLAAAARLLSTGHDDRVTVTIAATPSHPGVGGMLRAVSEHIAVSAWTVHVQGNGRR